MKFFSKILFSTYALTSIAVASECKTIAIQGDSIVYGQDMSAAGNFPPINGASQLRSSRPFPESIEKKVGPAILVRNDGFPGDRTIDGYVRWQYLEKSDVTVFLYGGNDAFNFGRASTGTLSIDSYKFVLKALVERETKRGSKAIILAPPPLKDKGMDGRLDAYRESARAVAKETNAQFIDLTRALLTQSNIWVDGTHLTAESNDRIAELVSSAILAQNCSK